jgi:hypothetical protein
MAVIANDIEAIDRVLDVTLPPGVPSV